MIDLGTLVSVLLVVCGAMVGVMQWFRSSTERWCRDMFVLNSDFTALQQQVLSIKSDLQEIKTRINQVYEKLSEKS